MLRHGAPFPVECVSAPWSAHPAKRKTAWAPLGVGSLNAQKLRGVLLDGVRTGLLVHRDAYMRPLGLLRSRFGALLVRLMRSQLEALIDFRRLHAPLYMGPQERVKIDETAVILNAVLGTWSGDITIGAYAFLGPNVVLAAGTHDPQAFDLDRQRGVPMTGYDIEIGDGAWIAAGATVLGPCRIGQHAIVAAGAVVTADVPALAVVAGVPARVVRHIDARQFPDTSGHWPSIAFTGAPLTRWQRGLGGAMIRSMSRRLYNPQPSRSRAHPPFKAPSGGSRWTHPKLESIWRVVGIGDSSVRLADERGQFEDQLSPVGDWPHHLFGAWERVD